MAQHDYNIVDEATLVVRTEFNSILAAVLSSNSGPVEPLNLYGGMFWYDTDNKLLKPRNRGNSAWGTPVATGIAYLPTAGGTLANPGNLTVNGTFSNPGYDGWRINNAAIAAPAQSVAGQLFWNSSTDILQVRNGANNAWIAAIDMTTPVFTDTMTITSTTQANLIFSSLGESRYLYNDAPNNRIGFWTSADGTAAYITDTGDLGLKALGYASLQTLLNGKQPDLNFTYAPVRQTGSYTVAIGGSPPRLYLNGADQGVINFGAAPLSLPNSGGVEAFGQMRTTAAVAAGGTTAGANLYFYPNFGSPALGTWRNMGAAVAVNGAGLYQRIA